MIEQEAINKIRTLEVRQRWYLAILVLMFCCIVGLALSQMSLTRWIRTPQSLRVRQLAVVDEHGIERVLLAAPLPDPIVLGKRVSRGGAVSGIIILDSFGNERGGYATDDKGDNAMLTLDGRASQNVLLLVEPDGSTTFKLWNKKASAFMGVGDNPFLNLKQGGKPLFIEPPDNPESKDPRPFFQ
jgi:hypothetical protein